jgi:hypothetical protein
MGRHTRKLQENLMRQFFSWTYIDSLQVKKTGVFPEHKFKMIAKNEKVSGVGQL